MLPPWRSWCEPLLSALYPIARNTLKPLVWGERLALFVAEPFHGPNGADLAPTGYLW